MKHRHDKPQSFHASPAEALQAPPEEFLYLACLHEGTGVERPDFLARRRRRVRPDRARDADAERRRRAASLRLEPLQLGLPRARPLAPDRARLSLVADPRRERRRRPAAAADREGDRADEVVRATGLTRPHTVHCMPGEQHRHQHARRRRRQRRLRLRRARRAHVRGQGPLGGRRRRTRDSTTTSGTSRARTCSPPRSSASPTRTRPGFDLDDVAAGRYGSRLHFWNLSERGSSRRSSSARPGSSRSKCAGCTIPTPTRASSAPRCRARCGTSTATTAPTAPTR